ncbi:MAG: YybS family protein [Pseudomonadota bacterium]
MNQGRTRTDIWTLVAAAFKEPGLALGAGAAVGLFLAISFVPMIGIFAGVFTPVPLLYYYQLRGRVFGLTMIGAASLIVILIYAVVDNLFGGLMFLEYALLAAVMGEGFRRGLRPEKVVGYAAGAVMGLALLGLIFSGVFQGRNPLDLARETVARQVKVSLYFYESLLTGGPGQVSGPGPPPEAGKDPGAPQGGGDAYLKPGDPTKKAVEGGGLSENDFNSVVRVMVAIFPGLIMAVTFLVAWANFMFGRWLFTRKGVLPPALADLTRWKAPERLVFVVIACGFGVFLPVSQVKFICLNVLMVVGLLYFFQGLAVVSYWLNKKGVPAFFRAFLYALIALQQYLAMIIAALGLFDLWFDFRKLKKVGEGPQT